MGLGSIARGLSVLTRAVSTTQKPKTDTEGWAVVATAGSPITVVLESDETSTPRAVSENLVGKVQVGWRVRVAYYGTRLVLTDAPTKVDALFGTTIPSGSDLNSYTSAGFYRVNSNAEAANVANMPVSYGGALLVFSGSGPAPNQVYIASGQEDVQVYRRCYRNDLGAWQPWKSNWGDAERIPANADFNSYITPGEYYSPANADVATMANRPSDYAGSLVVLRSSGYIQYWHEYNTGPSGRIFRRRQYNGTWSAWECVWVRGDSEDTIVVNGIVYARSGHYEATAVTYSSPDYSSAPIYIWNVTKTNPFTPPDGWVFKPHVITSNGHTFVEMAGQTSTDTTFRLMNIGHTGPTVRLGWTLVKRP